MRTCGSWGGGKEEKNNSTHNACRTSAKAVPPKVKTKGRQHDQSKHPKQTQPVLPCPPAKGGRRVGGVKVGVQCSI